MALLRAHMFYHTEEQMHEEGVEWDGVVYGIELGQWSVDWLEEGYCGRWGLTMWTRVVHLLPMSLSG